MGGRQTTKALAADGGSSRPPEATAGGSSDRRRVAPRPASETSLTSGRPAQEPRNLTAACFAG